MADDRDVLRAVWDGRVPAAFTLSPFEVETLTAPPPFYLMLPRQSYITVCTDKVRIWISTNFKFHKRFIGRRRSIKSVFLLVAG